MKQLMSNILNVVISITFVFMGLLSCRYLNDLYTSYQASHTEPGVLNYQDSRNHGVGSSDHF